MMAKTKVYSLLTLDAETIAALLPGCDIAPPVGRHDVLADIHDGYQALVIIDGRFHHSAAVSCDELMDALRAGLAVFGASSMGALRAAELQRYGMVGVGKIFEHIRDAGVFRDDYLGQTFSESPDGVRALSIPFVDIHFALERLCAAGALSQRIAEAIREVASALHYTERTPQILKEALAEAGHRDREVLQLVDVVATEESQKRRDAVAVLEHVRTHLARVQAANARLDEATGPLATDR